MSGAPLDEGIKCQTKSSRKGIEMRDTPSKLYREFSARGWTRKATSRIISELAFHICLMLGSIAVLVAVDNIWWEVLACYAMTLGGLGIATNCHSASHSSASDQKWGNLLLTFFGYPLNVGLSATFWHNKHVIVHHTTPNVVGLDDDIDLLPFFALTENDINDSRGLVRWWYRHQWMILPLAILLNGFSMQRQGWQFLIGKLRDSKNRKWLHWMDLAALILHLSLWVLLPMLLFPALHVLLFYLLRISLLGYAIFAVFAPAHFPAESLFLSAGKQDLNDYLRSQDWALLQCATSTNLKTGWLGNLFCSGTDYQIEHHLFPNISHPYLPRMAPLVQEWCAENGYPYRRLGFIEGFWKSWMTFRFPKKVHTDARIVRQPVTHDEQAKAPSVQA